MRALRVTVWTICTLFSSIIYANSVYVSAAASLTPSLNELVSEYKKQYPQDAIKLNFASSSVLARQIQYGVESDLFITANSNWIDYLKLKNKLVNKSWHILISNQLVFVRNKLEKKEDTNQTCFDQQSTADLLLNLSMSELRFGVAALDSVPLGIYTKQTLEKLDLLNDLKADMIPSANARSTLAFVERQMVNFAFLYYSDAINSEQVDILCIIPSDFHDPIDYYIAKVKRTKTSDSNKLEAVERFYQFLQTQSAQDVFVKHGFLEPNK